MIPMRAGYIKSLNLVFLSTRMNCWTWTPQGASEYLEKLERIGASNEYDLELIGRNIECLAFALRYVPECMMEIER